MYTITEIELFKASANYNYLFTRLGNVLILFALFYTFERFLKQSLILKIGQKTLSIYVIHFIIIYGSYTGFGLSKYLRHALNPAEVIIGALGFILIVCFISFHYAKTNAFLYGLFQNIVERFKK